MKIALKILNVFCIIWCVLLLLAFIAGAAASFAISVFTPSLTPQDFSQFLSQFPPETASQIQAAINEAFGNVNEFLAALSPIFMVIGACCLIMIIWIIAGIVFTAIVNKQNKLDQPSRKKLIVFGILEVVFTLFIPGGVVAVVRGAISGK